MSPSPVRKERPITQWGQQGSEGEVCLLSRHGTKIGQRQNTLGNCDGFTQAIAIEGMFINEVSLGEAGENLGF